MSTEIVTMYRVVCDWPDCGASAQDGGEFHAWAEASSAIEEADSAGWSTGCVADTHYCEGHRLEWSCDHGDGEPWPEPPYLRRHDGDDGFPDHEDMDVCLVLPEGVTP